MLCCYHRYDSHRDAILRSGETHQAGGDGGVTPGQRPSDELDPFQYFTTSCYNGYNDGAKVLVLHGFPEKCLMNISPYSLDVEPPNLRSVYDMSCLKSVKAACYSDLAGRSCFGNDCGTIFCPAILQGFYTVYRTVFQELAKEERQAAQFNQQSNSTASELPAFGELMMYDLQFNCCDCIHCRHS